MSVTLCNVKVTQYVDIYKGAAIVMPYEVILSVDGAGHKLAQHSPSDPYSIPTKKHFKTCLHVVWRTDLTKHVVRLFTV